MMDSGIFIVYIAMPATLLPTLAVFAKKNSDSTLCLDRIADDKAGFVGNPDFYGLGIRLGFYFQWVAFILANALLPNDRRALAATYAILSLAFELALLVLTFSQECVFDAEVMVILFIFFGGILNAIAPLGGAVYVYGSIFYGISALRGLKPGNEAVPNEPVPEALPLRSLLRLGSVGVTLGDRPSLPRRRPSTGVVMRDQGSQHGNEGLDRTEQTGTVAPSEIHNEIAERPFGRPKLTRNCRY
jgi:hypothetical protein